jgi:pimeloyl-ACP methyl ester carboxylesterase
LGLGVCLGAHAQDLTIPAALAPPLFVDCRGAPSASPTVILEAGAFGTSADWDRVLDDLAPGGKVCAYDRAGVGLSPPRPGGLGVLDKARELRGLLDQIGERGPIILVGHSNGALYAEAFARLYPARVVGFVYVNGVGTDDLNFPPLMANLADERRLSKFAATVARLGLAPLVADTLSEGGLSPSAERRKRAALECLRCLEVARDEDSLIVAGLKATAALPDDVRHIPTVVIVGDPSPDFDLAPIWLKAEIAPAARADTSWILDAPGASHVSPLSRDRAYVDAAVAWLRAPYLKAP